MRFRKPQRGQAERAPVRVLAAVDLTPVSHRVMNWAAAAAINVYAKDEQDRRELRIADLLTFHEKLKPIPLVVRGDPILQLFSHIEQFGATLVVLGQHSQRKPRDSRAIFGSVCRYVTTFARVNTLVVPAH